MMIPAEKQAIRNTINLLCEWLNCEISSEDVFGGVVFGDGIDARLELNNIRFLIEYKHSGKISYIANGIQQLKKTDDFAGDAVKLLVVPFMHELGRVRCKDAGVSWIDLSGNADVIGPGIRIHIQGKPDCFKQPGRPTNVFAPKSSRVARILLYNSDVAFTQRELSEKTGLDEGYVSRIVRKLEEQELIVRAQDDRLVAKDIDLLLDAWLESYDFTKHTIHRGHVPARSGPALLQTLSDALIRARIKHAATGLGAAWQYTRFATFRTVSIFIDEPLSFKTLADLDFTEADTGFNTWLILPDDESVFWKADSVDGIACVHPIQTYMDLKGHPERADEAMSELRRMILE